jgi:hypothetical protein
MMHKKNFVAAIKVGGKVLRESSDRVELPFGSEYSILLKNLDTVRMQAKISIDGTEATGWLVLGPNSSMEVERFVKDLDRGNRFKFIERTEKIENHRGVQAEDGLIRVEFKREKVYEAPKITEHHTYHHHYNDYYYPWNRWYGPYYNTITTSWRQGGIIDADESVNNSFQFTKSLSGSQSQSRSMMAQNSQTVSQSMGNSGGIVSACNFNDAGITVPGSLSDQRFVTVSGFETEASEVIVLHLIGRKGTAVIPVARTVAQRPTCETCGKRNLPTAKYCIECGTSLERV